MFAVLAVGANFLVRRTPERSVDLAQGRHLYAVHCASCHGANLEGQPDWQTRRSDGRLPAPPHDATGHSWHHSDAMLFEITRDGIGKFAPAGYLSDMPAFKGVLSDDEIRAVLGYVKSTWPAEIQARHATLK
jgi:mono/diheme cytochrome c family protein